MFEMSEQDCDECFVQHSANHSSQFLVAWPSSQFNSIRFLKLHK